LPLENTLKQQLLEVPDCMERAAILHAELIRLGVIQYVKPESL
jgi:Lon protease-like protein